MSAVDELIARIHGSAWGDAPDELDVQMRDVERLIREAFAPGGPCLTREQVVEACGRWLVARGYRGHLADAFRSGEEPR